MPAERTDLIGRLVGWYLHAADGAMAWIRRLNAHPSVAEGAAVAAPDPRYGDVVGAVVALKPGAALDLDGLRAHFASSGLAKQKTPERLAIVDALPRTALGKIRKAELRTQHFGG